MMPLRLFSSRRRCGSYITMLFIGSWMFGNVLLPHPVHATDPASARPNRILPPTVQLWHGVAASISSKLVERVAPRLSPDLDWWQRHAACCCLRNCARIQVRHHLPVIVPHRGRPGPLLRAHDTGGGEWCRRRRRRNRVSAVEHLPAKWEAPLGWRFSAPSQARSPTRGADAATTLYRGLACMISPPLVLRVLL